ncbi:MAG: bifunctional folylpolyglutamate synthase/dihydrofolate synthase, partial [Patescibacteria group bacterium]
MSKLSWQLEYMYGLERFGIRLGLEAMEEFMRALDRPHEKFKSVHVSGTNGKGSTAILTANALQAGGFRVGFYNSPHLIHF